MGDEPLTVAHNSRSPCERCIHNLSSGCWLRNKRLGVRAEWLTSRFPSIS
jgi:hypothetical protein